MRSRTPLVVMEQLVMVLVFALAAALCLQCFALSDRLSRQDREHSRGALLVQNAAETVKACGGDMEQAASRLGGVSAGDRWVIYYDENGVMAEDAAAFRLELWELADSPDGLGQAKIQAVGGEEQILFAVTVAWQEGEHE